MTRSTIPRRRGRTPVCIDLAPAHLDQLRAMLEQQRDFRIDQLVALHGVDHGGHPERLEGANREVHDSLVVGALAALQDVQAALQRMDTGHYGTCLDCQAPLELERLEILPQVARCLPCQRAAVD
jgi:DnaK suppressor protein